MPKIQYKEIRFNRASKAVIEQANKIIEEFLGQGFDLTLRQLYYQFVARDLIPNTPKDYKRLGEIVNNARLAGLIDWNRISDRTRFIRTNSHWETPGGVIRSAAHSFGLDLWKDQPYRVEVWIEKDALVGVISSVCMEMDVPYFSCRGYTSQSEMWAAAMRLRSHIDGKQTPIIIHLGDHDPSGKDMTRDISERLSLFMGGCQVIRVALNMNQVEEHSPPPNPAKITDSRAQAYIAEFGNESWELDALSPALIQEMVRNAIKSRMDLKKWGHTYKKQEDGRRLLMRAADDWKRIEKNLKRKRKG